MAWRTINEDFELDGKFYQLMIDSDGNWTLFHERFEVDAETLSPDQTDRIVNYIWEWHATHGD